MEVPVIDKPVAPPELKHYADTDAEHHAVFRAVLVQMVVQIFVQSEKCADTEIVAEIVQKRFAE